MKEKGKRETIVCEYAGRRNYYFLLLKSSFGMVPYLIPGIIFMLFLINTTTFSACYYSY
jgi:hypothetical protein